MEDLEPSNTHFYPRSPCGERLAKITSVSRGLNFYPRSPCGERQDTGLRRDRPKAFLSTLSLRRATSCVIYSQTDIGHFYPRSPCGERPVFPCFTIIDVKISIHALLAESDTAFYVDCLKRTYFYPRSPCGERHCFSVPYRFKVTISIHALLAESDCFDFEL